MRLRLFIVSLLAAGMVCVAAQAFSAQIRDPILAGTWYPGQEAELRRLIKSFLSQAKPPPIEGRLLALVVPHAGLPYSGPVAAWSYALLQQQPFDTAVIIAPSHRVAFEGVSVDTASYRTPLGVAEADAEFIAALQSAEPRIRAYAPAHAQEHAVEIQVPFLQVVLPEARMVSLVVGDQDEATCRWLGKALASTVRAFEGRRRVLVLASTDLSHFHDSNQARKLDQKVQDCINAFDPARLLACLADRSCEACGGAPLLATMYAAAELGANRGQVLQYADSGAVSGDHDRVVGYVAAAFSETKAASGASGPDRSAAQPDEEAYSQAERRMLLNIARDAISARLGRRDYKPPAELPAALKKNAAAFVTLKRQGELRGCIGAVVAQAPLHETVARMAQAAAFEDPRFPPLSKEELSDLDVDISVLSAPRRLADPEQVQVGRHGLIVRRGLRSGLLLPQVAPEQGWNREQLLENTCRKAGLPPDAWKDKDTELYVFTAEVF